MKFNHTLQNQQGSALIEVLAAMGILLFVITGMMITISYARYKSTTNYHYRIALLRAESELQRIKMQHYTNGYFGSLATKAFTIQHETNAKPINANIYFSSSTVNDPQTSLRASYTTITAKVKWREAAPMFALFLSPNDEKEIVLREDYYFERTQ
jgi:Tfp pilus assembly protein PilV